jgi:thioredoxin 1
MFKSLTREEEFNSFLQQEKLVLVKFSAEWCPPCQVLQKNLEKLLDERKANKQPDLVVLAVDADRFPQLKYQDQAQKVQQIVVHSLPTLFLFQQNRMLKKAVGSMSVQELKEFVNA